MLCDTKEAVMVEGLGQVGSGSSRRRRKKERRESAQEKKNGRESLFTEHCLEVLLVGMVIQEKWIH